MTPEKTPPKGAFAALDELVATIILLVARSLNFFVVLIVRMTGRVEAGGVSRPAETAVVLVPAIAAETRAVTPPVAIAPPVAVPSQESEVPAPPAAAPARQAGHQHDDEPRPQHRVGQATPRPARAMPVDETPTAAPAARRNTAVEGETRVYRGFIAWHGVQTFRPAGRKEYDSYALHLNLGGGNEEILQGKELEAAIAASGADIGDRVEVRFEGKEYVRSFQNKKLFRNKWAVARIN